jgi:hypothetical protein
MKKTFSKRAMKAHGRAEDIRKLRLPPGGLSRLYDRGTAVYRKKQSFYGKISYMYGII